MDRIDRYQQDSQTNKDNLPYESAGPHLKNMQSFADCISEKQNVKMVKQSANFEDIKNKKNLLE